MPVNMIGESREFLSVRKAIEMVAPLDSTVLVLGETGTGKEVGGEESNVTKETLTQQELALALHQYTKHFRGSYCASTAIEGLTIFRLEQELHVVPQVFNPAICIMFQSSDISMRRERDDDPLVDDAPSVIMEVPYRGTVPADSFRPRCVGLVIELNRAYTREVIEDLGIHPKPVSKHRPSRVLALEFSPQLFNCALRSVRLLDTPEAISVLYPGIMREICYWLLTGPACDQIVTLTMPDVYDSRVLQAIRELQGKFRDQIRVEDLASLAGMSTATFHRQFKSVTAMAPLQYKKQLRLLEARRLLITSNYSVETVAFEVGYASASQFSREFTRMFGASPRRDMTARRLFHSTAPHVAASKQLAS